MLSALNVCGPALMQRETGKNMMPNVSLGILVGSLILLSNGCAPSWKIVGGPSGMTRQEAAQIIMKCQASGPQAYPTNNLGVVYGQSVNRNAAMRLCLEANGIETADE